MSAIFNNKTKNVILHTDSNTISNDENKDTKNQSVEKDSIKCIDDKIQTARSTINENYILCKHESDRHVAIIKETLVKPIIYDFEIKCKHIIYNCIFKNPLISIKDFNKVELIINNFINNCIYESRKEIGGKDVLYLKYSLDSAKLNGFCLHKYRSFLKDHIIRIRNYLINIGRKVDIAELTNISRSMLSNSNKNNFHESIWDYVQCSHSLKPFLKESKVINYNIKSKEEIDIEGEIEFEKYRL